MKRTLSLLITFLALAVGSMCAQMFTATPTPLQNSSKNVVITFHAAESGVSGLMNMADGTSLYAHIGATTNKKTKDWAYTPTVWTTNNAANEFKWVSKQTYQLTIADMREFFGITDPEEVITKIAVIARKASASNSATDQTKDCFIEVAPDGFAISFAHNQDYTTITKPATFKFTLYSSENASLDISVNGSSIASTKGTALVKEYTFSNSGVYTVKATANNGSETLTQSVEVNYIGKSPAANYPGGVPKMGPVVNSDGSVTFCLAAPQKENVTLVGSWDNYVPDWTKPMSYQDYNGCRYFWKTISGLDPDTDYMYYFCVDGNINVGDPYAKVALDPYYDSSLKADVYPDRPKYPFSEFKDRLLAVHRSNFAPYNWKFKDFKIPAHDQLLVYELLIRDFTGTEGRKYGLGNLRQAFDKIQYLKELGVNAIELMPVMEFNGNNSWGYNTNFYFALDKAYGSPEDLKKFVDYCHGEGMAVILDVVFNHSDGLHPWYQMYPIASNPFYNATCPHNWGVLNDWKQENPVVQQQFKDVLQYWMREYDIDGYRFDLVKGLGTSYGQTDGYNASRIPVMQAFHDAIREVKPDGIHINEFLGDYNEELKYCEDGQIGWNNQSGNSISWAKGTASNLNYFSSTKCSRPYGTVISYAESHDEQRVGYEALKNGTTKIKEDKTFRTQNLGSLAAQQFMTPGPQMLWQFMELGADETTKSANGDNNTGNKTVIWSRLDDDDYKGLHDSYASLISLRRKNPEVFGQNTGSFNYAGTGIRMGQFASGNKEVVVLVNASSTETKTASFTPQKMTASSYQIMSQSHGIATLSLAANGSELSVAIPPRCYAVYASTAVTGIDDVWADSVSGDENAPVEYFSLQGIRIQQPEPGQLVIRRQGSNVTKLLVK